MYKQRKKEVEGEDNGGFEEEEVPSRRCCGGLASGCVSSFT